MTAFSAPPMAKLDDIKEINSLARQLLRLREHRATLAKYGVAMILVYPPARPTVSPDVGAGVANPWAPGHISLDSLAPLALVLLDAELDRTVTRLNELGIDATRDGGTPETAAPRSATVPGENAVDEKWVREHLAPALAECAGDGVATMLERFAGRAAAAGGDEPEAQGGAS